MAGRKTIIVLFLFLISFEMDLLAFWSNFHYLKLNNYPDINLAGHRLGHIRLVLVFLSLLDWDNQNLLIFKSIRLRKI